MKKILALILALTMLLSLAACGGGNAGNETKAPEGNENVQAGEKEPVEVVPTKGGDWKWIASMYFIGMLNTHTQGTVKEFGWACMEPLGYIVPGETEWKLQLAESYEIDKENATITVKVKEGITFHDGDTLDAEDVAFSIGSRIDFGTAGVIGNPLEVNVLDTYTVEVKYAAYSPCFEEWILPTWVYSKNTFDAIGAEGMLQWMNGTGPYVMSEYVPDVSIKYVRNENYWNPYETGPETIEIVAVADETSRLASFLSGESDMIVTSSAETIAQLQQKGYEVMDLPNGEEIQYILLPITLDPDAPLSKKEVRQALYLYGIDWDGFAYALYGDLGFHTDAAGMTSYGYYKEDLEQSAVDYEKCKQLLADAGYPNGFETVIYGSATSTTMATILQAELAKVGVTAEVKILDSADMSELNKGLGPKTGIACDGRLYTPSQTDRFNKFYSHLGTLAGMVDWPDEVVAAYEAVRAAQSVEEQNSALYDYVKMYVLEEALYWPVANSGSKVAFQPWFSTTTDAYHHAMGGYDVTQFILGEH